MSREDLGKCSAGTCPVQLRRGLGSSEGRLVQEQDKCRKSLRKVSVAWNPNSFDRYWGLMDGVKVDTMIHVLVPRVEQKMLAHSMSEISGLLYGSHIWFTELDFSHQLLYRQGKGPRREKRDEMFIGLKRGQRRERPDYLFQLRNRVRLLNWSVFVEGRGA